MRYTFWFTDDRVLTGKLGLLTDASDVCSVAIMEIGFYTTKVRSCVNKVDENSTLELIKALML